jgi:hypothetical protein
MVVSALLTTLAHPPHVTLAAFRTDGIISREKVRNHNKYRLFMAFIPLLALTFAAMACVQDCMGVTFSVKGRVLDKSGNPISNAQIMAWNNGSFERPAFNIGATSDTNGYFDTESAFSYGCTQFQVKVTADGYKAFTTAYYPPAKEGWNNELPPEITITLDQG